MGKAEKIDCRTNLEVGFSPFMNDSSISDAILVEEPKKDPTAGMTAPARAIAKSLIAGGYTGANLPEGAKDDGLTKLLEERRIGRQSLFTLDKAADFIEAIENGSSIEEACAEIGVGRKVVWTWRQLSPPFSNAFAEARRTQADAMADDAVQIIDNTELDPENPKHGAMVLRKADSRARIRMELAKCFNFQQYGDKKQTLNLNVNAEVSPVDLSRYM